MINRRNVLGLLSSAPALLAQPQLDQYTAVIRKRLLTGTEGMQVWFNKIYTTSEGSFSERPNAFLAQVVEDLQPGAALDVAMGQGRNSVFLARRVWLSRAPTPSRPA